MSLDRRTAYTKRVIKEALFELIEDNSVDEITIKEICAKADINRATFYRHYENIYDLFTQVASELSAASLENNVDNASFLENLPHQLSLHAEHKVFYMAMVKHGTGAMLAQQNIEENLQRHIAWRTSMGESEALARAEFEFVSSGVTAVINKWVFGGCVEPIDDVVSHIATITSRVYALS